MDWRITDKEGYIEEGLKKFHQEVEEKIGKLIDDIEPYITDLLRGNIYANIKRSTEMFLSSPDTSAVKLDNSITDIKSNYADIPYLMEASLKAAEDQFYQLLVSHQNNLDNYIAGMKRELIK